ncbi:MAG: B-box zinc finger protein, partial [Dehalococcoidia bacterium]
MYCARHPKVETNLRCGKCEQPICPKCVVQTPVGARCPDCAKLTRLPIFQVSILDHLKAVGVGLGLALSSGTAWGIIGPDIPLFSYLIALAVGYMIGELGSLSVNRKRGAGLQVIFGVSVL